MIRISHVLLLLVPVTLTAACGPDSGEPDPCFVTVNLRSSATTVCSADQNAQFGLCELVFPVTPTGEFSALSTQGAGTVGGSSCGRVDLNRELASDTDPSFSVQEPPEDDFDPGQWTGEAWNWDLGFAPQLDADVAGKLVITATPESGEGVTMTVWLSGTTP